MQFLLVILSLVSLVLAKKHILPHHDGIMSKNNNKAMMPLSTCDSSNSFKISSLEFLPYPPKTGESLKVVASGHLYDTITQGASLQVVLKYRFITVHEQTNDLCEAVKGTLDCPIQPGDLNNLQAMIPIPASAPHMTYNIKVLVRNGDGSTISCLEGPIKFN